MKQLCIRELGCVSGGGFENYAYSLGVFAAGAVMFTVGMLGLCPPIRSGSTSVGLFLPGVIDMQEYNATTNTIVQEVHDEQHEFLINKPVLGCGASTRWCCGTGFGACYNYLVMLGVGFMIGGITGMGLAGSF